MNKLTIDNVLKSKSGKRIKQLRYWVGDVDDCNLCNKRIDAEFVDGATRMGPWAIMCKPCARKHGVGVGMGRGQVYTKQADGRWLKTGG